MESRCTLWPTLCWQPSDVTVVPDNPAAVPAQGVGLHTSRRSAPSVPLRRIYLSIPQPLDAASVPCGVRCFGVRRQRHGYWTASVSTDDRRHRLHPVAASFCRCSHRSAQRDSYGRTLSCNRVDPPCRTPADGILWPLVVDDLRNRAADPRPYVWVAWSRPHAAPARLTPRRMPVCGNITGSRSVDTDGTIGA